MFISVQGNLINTKDIYLVGPVRLYGSGGPKFFVIKFFNLHSLDVFVDAQRIEEVRNRVIEHWNLDKTDVPQIE